jgi:hypothetical protein
MHWDGTAWTQVPSPNPTNGSYLEDVVALAPDNVWAVGYTYLSTAKTLIEHWDGTQWSVVNSPNQGPSTNELMAIDAVSPTDMWAVGNTPGSHNTVTLHWNGSQWLIVPSLPNDFMNYYVLEDVVAIASNDVWAVGYQYPESGAHKTVIIHWNGSSWSRVNSPNPGAYVSRLYGAVAVSANEVWAAGVYSNNGGATYQTLILKWNGTTWTHIPSPDGSVSGYNLLYGITRGPDGDLWAVGLYHVQNHPSSPANTLILRWDGSTWQVVGSPNGFRSNSELYGVDSAPSGDLWTVGRSYTSYDSPWDTLIERSMCTVVTPTVTGTPPTATPPLPSATPTACGASNTNYTIATSAGATVVPATTDIGLNCDTCATTISLPFPFALYGQPFNSAIVGSNGTMGFVANSNVNLVTCMPTQEFNYAILPYWQQLHLSNQGNCPTCGIFTSVEGTAPNRIFNIEWRARDYFYTAFVNVEVRLYEGNSTFEVIYGSVPSGSNQQVTVGVQQDLGTRYTQYVCNNASGTIANGTKLTFSQPSCSTATPTAIPSSTGTPAPPTSTQAVTSTPTRSTTTTQVPSTQTPSVSTHTVTPVASPGASGTPIIASATPTICPIQFTDVPEGYTFYAQIRCLACQAILGGYDDGTFKPDNLITRGQIAKVVSNAAGLADDPGGQMFEDVPISNTFFVWINRLASRGHMSGYPCGSEGEPCGAENRPYFRPFADATRAQIAKIVSNAAGYSDTPTGQMFEDVAIDHPFYVWVQRLASRGHMSGYPCGSEGEPCGAENRPYFRPYNNATRGQTSKIVANTFFPDCTAGR